MKPVKRSDGRHLQHVLVRLGCLLSLLLCACSDPVTPVEPQAMAPVQKSQAKPANFILCIDNSRSIRGEEQILIRETAMLLADLAEKGDRVTVITFGEGARVAAESEISTDEDRVRFKQRIDAVVRFDEDYSDIRAGLQALFLGSSAPTKLGGYHIHCIVLSDGKLEPADRQTPQAFAELKDLLQNQLAAIDIHAVVLGDTHCHDTIMDDVDDQPMTGLRLMRDYLSSSPAQFHHAIKLDQLLPFTVEILNQTKGSSAIGQQSGKTQFKIDDSVTSMTLVVKKRSIDGTELCKSSEINLNQPQGTTDNAQQSIYRSSNYRFFDLIVVRHPTEGVWSVSLPNNQAPEVLSKIVTPLKLQYAIRDQYYSNESALCRAWLFDESAEHIVDNQPLQIKAKLRHPTDAKPSDLFLDLHKDDESSMFFLRLPAELVDTAQEKQEIKEVALQFIAQRFRPGTTDLDPWFVRTSPLVTVKILDSFVDWQLTQTRALKLPFVNSDLNFGAQMPTEHPHRPNFETPPRLKFTLERYDVDHQRYVVISDLKLDGIRDESVDHFDQLISLKSLKTGSYRYRYALVDSVVKDGGPFNMQSPFFTVHIQSYAADSWQFWAVCSILALLGLFLLSGLSAKMQGTINTDGTSQLVNTKTFVSEASYQNRFILKAKKVLFVKSFILLKVTAGYVKVDGQMLAQGQRVKLYPAQVHSIEHDEGNRKIERQLMLNV